MGKGNYKRKDHYYEKAKQSGYRSRAAYKLLELNRRFRLLKKGSAVLDLGCWPGGWVQVAAQKVGSEGLVAGVDLKKTDPLPSKNIFLFQGDVRDEEVIEKLLQETERERFHCILSDMSPKITGIRSVDQVAVAACGELAFFVAENLLETGGALVLKLFPGNDTEEFIRSLRGKFSRINRFTPDSTRKSSKEFYLVCLSYRSNTD